MTSLTRLAGSPQVGQEKLTSSTYGRCRSSSEKSSCASSDSSVSDPTQTWWSCAQRQIGSGVPQYRDRDSAQSTLLSSQSPYRPCLIESGYQFVRSFSRRRASLICVVRMYQDGWA